MSFNLNLGHFTSAVGSIPQWTSGTTYALNQVVIKDDLIYRCSIAHTASASFATDQSSKWAQIGGSPGVVATPEFGYASKVGTASQVSGGTANFSSIQAAINAAASGDRILLLPSTYSENVTVNKSLSLEGVGIATALSGNLSVSGSYCQIMGIKVTGNFGTVAGANYNYIRCWVSGTVTDLGGSNSIDIIQA